jgi:hypothetical protein
LLKENEEIGSDVASLRESFGEPSPKITSHW